MGTIKGEARELSEEQAKCLTYGTHYTAGKGVKERLEDYEGFLERLKSHGAKAARSESESGSESGSGSENSHLANDRPRACGA